MKGAWGWVMRWGPDGGWEVQQPVYMRLEDWPSSDDLEGALAFIEEHVREPGDYKLFSPTGSVGAKVRLRAEAVKS